MAINERKLVSPIRVVIRFIVALILIFLQVLIYWYLFIGSLDIPYIYLVFKVVSIILVIKLYNSNDNLSYKILWIIIILLLNVTGPLFYLCFGNGNSLPKRKSRKINGYINTKIISSDILEEIKKSDNLSYRLSKYLNSVTGFYPSKNDNEYFFKSGSELFLKMIEEIDKAKKYIFLEYYIVSSGYMLDTLIDHLTLASNRGVEIKFIYDYVGCNISRVLKRKDLKRLKEIPNLTILAFNQPKITLNLGINYRNHRKLLLIDGVISFVGGINIADEYIDKKKRFGIWRDNAVMIVGEGTYNYVLLFLSSWYLATNIKLEIEDYIYKPNDVLLDGYVFTFGDGPNNKHNPVYNLYLKMIENAKSKIYISTPYFIIDNLFINTLINQINSGVEVIILIPEIPDKKFVYLMSLDNLRKIINSGGKVYKFKDGFNHAKTLIIDGMYALVGTANVDYRSMFLHYETGCLLMKKRVIEEIEKDFLENVNVSILLERDTKNNVFGKVLSYFYSLIGPLF